MVVLQAVRTYSAWLLWNAVIGDFGYPRIHRGCSLRSAAMHQGTASATGPSLAEHGFSRHPRSAGAIAICSSAAVSSVTIGSDRVAPRAHDKNARHPTMDRIEEIRIECGDLAWNNFDAYSAWPRC